MIPPGPLCSSCQGQCTPQGVWLPLTIGVRIKGWSLKWSQMRFQQKSMAECAEPPWCCAETPSMPWGWHCLQSQASCSAAALHHKRRMREVKAPSERHAVMLECFSSDQTHTIWPWTLPAGWLEVHRALGASWECLGTSLTAVGGTCATMNLSWKRVRERGGKDIYTGAEGTKSWLRVCKAIKHKLNLPCYQLCVPNLAWHCLQCSVPTPVVTQGCSHFCACLFDRQLCAPSHPTPWPQWAAEGLWPLPQTVKGNQNSSFKPQLKFSSWQRRRGTFSVFSSYACCFRGTLSCSIPS